LQPGRFGTIYYTDPARFGIRIADRKSLKVFAMVG
jgi:hypothetical protein